MSTKIYDKEAVFNFEVNCYNMVISLVLRPMVKLFLSLFISLEHVVELVTKNKTGIKF